MRSELYELEVRVAGYQAAVLVDVHRLAAELTAKQLADPSRRAELEDALGRCAAR